MSSCLSGGGGRTYGFDLEIVKPLPSTSPRTSSHSSSPSSTISESSNSPLAISTRKPRTPRKRPNQTYNEAAVLLSTAYPNLFSTKHLTKPSKYTKPYDYSLFDDSAHLLLPCRVIDSSGFLLHQPILEKPGCRVEPRVTNLCEKSCESGRQVDTSKELLDEYCEDFDTESILDEEIEEGIDSIMGNLSVENNNDLLGETNVGGGQINSSWFPMGLGFGSNFELGLGLRRGVRALRHVDDRNWWSFPTVDVLQISPRFNNGGDKNKKVFGEKKKKKKKVEKPDLALETNSKSLDLAEEKPNSKPSSGLQLKLNYDDVLNAWSDRGSPFSDDVSGSEAAGNDVSARLAQMELFLESGVREASVLRYKEKRRTRLFSKKIRYQVRKVNADRRPRMKGRFVRRPGSSSNAQR